MGGFGMYPEEQEEYLALIDLWVNHRFDALDDVGGEKGEVTLEEFKRIFGDSEESLTRFHRLDANSDGKVNLAEFEAEVGEVEKRVSVSPDGRSKREVMLLGGDLHFSMESTVKHRGDNREV